MMDLRVKVSGLTNENARLKAELASKQKECDRMTQERITFLARIQEMKTVMAKLMNCIPVRLCGRTLRAEAAKLV